MCFQIVCWSLYVMLNPMFIYVSSSTVFCDLWEGDHTEGTGLCSPQPNWNSRRALCTSSPTQGKQALPGRTMSQLENQQVASGMHYNNPSLPFDCSAGARYSNKRLPYWIMCFFTTEKQNKLQLWNNGNVSKGDVRLSSSPTPLNYINKIYKTENTHTVGTHYTIKSVGQCLCLPWMRTWGVCLKIYAGLLGCVF